MSPRGWSLAVRLKEAHHVAIGVADRDDLPRLRELYCTVHLATHWQQALQRALQVRHSEGHEGRVAGGQERFPACSDQSVNL